MKFLLLPLLRAPAIFCCLAVLGAAQQTTTLYDVASDDLVRGPVALKAISTVTPAADKIPYYTSGSAAAVADFTAFGRTLAALADASSGRAALLPSYAGNALKVLTLNSGGTDVEWAVQAGSGTVTSVNISGGTTGLSASGGPVTGSGTITLAGTLATTNGGTGATTAADARTNLGLGSLATQSGTFSGTSSGTNTGDQTSIVGITGTIAQFNTALSDADFATGGGTATGTNTGDQTITLTGDATGSGTGSFATTLATVNTNTGSFGSSTSIPTFTVNGKGLITAASGNAVVAPAGTLTGTTLASGVVTSSLTTVGALNSGSIASGFGSINIGANSLTAGAISGSTGTFSGALAQNAGATNGLITLNSDNTTSGFGSLRIRTGASKTAWQISAQNNVDNGLEITPSTAVGGTTFSTPVATITSTGLNNTVIGATTPAAITGTSIGANTSFLLPDGTVGTATGAMYFANDTNTGFYRAGADTLGFMGNGSSLGTWSSTGLEVTGTASTTNGLSTSFNNASNQGLNIRETADTTDAFFAVFRKADTTAIGLVQRVGTTNAVAYNTTSDGRLKTNIRDFTAADSGRIIDGLRPRWFDWKASDLTETVEEEVATGKQEDGKPLMEKRTNQRKVTDPKRIAAHVANNKSIIGFIAQEEAAVDPALIRIGAVTPGDDDPDTITRQWSRSDAALVPVLVAEAKALRARVAALEAQNAAFEARLLALEKK